MRDIVFYMRTLDDAGWRLPQCAIESRGRRIVQHHLDPLIQFGKAMDASKREIRNCKKLGTGYDDLVVVLLEPSGKEDEIELEEEVEDAEWPNALTEVDEALQDATNGSRDIYNTIIMDIRPFRKPELQDYESNAERRANDATAYAAFIAALNMLRPKVILVCQCDSKGIRDGMPSDLCSSMSTAGEVTPWRMDNGHRTTIVNSFHPSHVLRSVNRWTEKPRDLLFFATYILAANALAGRKVVGGGVESLRNIVTAGQRRYNAERGQGRRWAPY